MNIGGGISNAPELVLNGTEHHKFPAKHDVYNGVQYNQMMDDSKQTEEADISRNDFTETHS